MNFKEATQYLMENGYLVQIKGKFRVTARFNKEMTGVETGLVMAGNQPVVIETALPVPGGTQQQIDWVQAYISFIKEAEVPARCESRDGSYDLNKYSEKAMKVFRGMLEKEGIVYAILVKSTLLYYKTHRRFAYTITRYIEEGFWRTDYDSLVSSAKEGTVEDHIQTQIDNDREFSRFRIG